MFYILLGRAANTYARDSS